MMNFELRPFVLDQNAILTNCNFSVVRARDPPRQEILPLEKEKFQLAVRTRGQKSRHCRKSKKEKERKRKRCKNGDKMGMLFVVLVLSQRTTRRVRSSVFDNNQRIGWFGWEANGEPDKLDNKWYNDQYV